MKKFIKGLLFSFSALLLVVALASCEMPTTPPATDECAHTATSWKNDGTNHWHLCTKCSEKYDEEAHKYGEWDVVENATTSSEGIKSRTCSVCSYVEYGVIDGTIYAKFIKDSSGDTGFDSLQFRVKFDYSGGE